MKLNLERNMIKSWDASDSEILKIVVAEGFRPFKTTVKAEGKTIHFMGDIKTHEIWVVYKRHGKRFTAYNSKVTTIDYKTGTDKLSFLKFALGQAVGLHATMAAQASFCCSVGNATVKDTIYQIKDMFA